MHVYFARRMHFGSRASFSVLSISFQSQLPVLMSGPADLVTPVSGKRLRRKTREEGKVFHRVNDTEDRLVTQIVNECRTSCNQHAKDTVGGN